jgi:hypothetical protein
MSFVECRWLWGAWWCVFSIYMCVCVCVCVCLCVVFVVGRENREPLTITSEPASLSPHTHMSLSLPPYYFPVFAPAPRPLNRKNRRHSLLLRRHLPLRLHRLPPHGVRLTRTKHGGDDGDGRENAYAQRHLLLVSRLLPSPAHQRALIEMEMQMEMR